MWKTFLNVTFDIAVQQRYANLGEGGAASETGLQ